MTRLKSAYRPKAYRDGGAVVKDEVIAVADVPTGDTGGVVDDGDEVDGASSAFKAQIENLLRAEEASKQRAQASPQQPTRAERLNKLRQGGLSEAAVSFLGSNHEIMDYPHLADQAARIARDEGYLPDTEAFFQAVKSNFRAITTPPPPASSVALEAAEKYSGGGASMPSLHDEASLDRNKFNRAAAMVSAPVSREVPSSSREDRVSSRVTLSLAEKEHARLAGVTETAYAQGKLELERRKRAGEI